MSIAAAFRRDANGVPITTHGLGTSKTIAFDGTAGNGATGTITLLTVTGSVFLNVFALCTEDLAGASATIEIGTATSTACLCDQVVGTTIDNHMTYHEGNLGVGANVASHSHSMDEDIILTIGTADLTNGTLEIYFNWTPLSEGSNAVIA